MQQVLWCSYSNKKDVLWSDENQVPLILHNTCFIFASYDTLKIFPLTNWLCGIRTRRFITAFTRTHQQSPSWARWIHSTPSPPANLPKVHFDCIPSTPWFFYWSFPPKPCTRFSPLTCPTHLIFLDLSCIISGDEYKLCNFLHCPITSSLLGPNILFSTLF
jgi:hypothetical protein